ncbi:Na+/H+ antiporter [Pseudochelatococcus contaminans]|uniref:CPA1 family monovalent cation:H+ antiporter n=1 Tax=Pseudochelatococcus contaminans TaxID=1538103 RepID=A0A7W5Z6D3_9HYPH|nr:Na+/H+ antiporter [Pseudochelatococcus contaminans]MBB3810675.1 CPA1 family monovalent cation:H+ antiporter [Pseudochelatococcus contaminans]
METFTVTLIVLAAIAFGTVIERILPLPVPAPLIQTALGVLISLTTSYDIEIEPHIFFIIFIPPLLFLDGWRIPNDELLRDSPTVLSLAIGLVVVTVLGAGLFIHWMVPAIPLGVAFALAAIISPTDPVAVSAIAARTPVPKRIMHILEGESLLNDASGLVAMKFAVAAVLTGSFSFFSASETFGWLALGGIVTGVAMTFVITALKSQISRRLGYHGPARILTSILTPFVAYIIAEHIEASGILAAVASGIAMSVAERNDTDLAVTRIDRKAVWETIYFAASGATFVILGEQLPRLIDGASDLVVETGHGNPLWIVVYVLAISAFLAAARFIWVKISLLLTFRKEMHGDTRLQTFRLTSVITLAGARGTVTLAGIMTLPLVMTDGSEFPARDLAILLAAGVILVSLIVASVGLPVALKGLRMDEGEDHEQQIDRALVLSAQAAIVATEKRALEIREDVDETALQRQTRLILDFYRNRIDEKTSDFGEFQPRSGSRELMRVLLASAVKAEREEVFRLVRAKELPEDAARKLVDDIDLIEARFAP